MEKSFPSVTTISDFTYDNLQPGDLVIVGFTTQPSEGRLIISVEPYVFLKLDHLHVLIVYQVLWSPVGHAGRIKKRRCRADFGVCSDDLDYVVRHGVEIARGPCYLGSHVPI
jgi:hypothetical protein